MKEEELIKKLESVELPDFELESHRRRLKKALLNSGYSKKEEVTFLATVGTQANGVSDTMSPRPVVHRRIWKPVLVGVSAMVFLIATYFSVPQASNLLKAALFPEGSRTISGTQLNVDDQKASDILMADPRIKELLAQGAVIDKILPIEVTAEVVNPATGKTETVKETWAQAWLVNGDKDWGVQIDLVQGKIVSITE